MKQKISVYCGVRRFVLDGFRFLFPIFSTRIGATTECRKAIPFFETYKVAHMTPSAIDHLSATVRSQLATNCVRITFPTAASQSGLQIHKRPRSSQKVGVACEPKECIKRFSTSRISSRLRKARRSDDYCGCLMFCTPGDRRARKKARAGIRACSVHGAGAGSCMKCRRRFHLTISTADSRTFSIFFPSNVNSNIHHDCAVVWSEWNGSRSVQPDDLGVAEPMQERIFTIALSISDEAMH